eukprot:2919686-Amphidinium_carterae.1
MVRGGKSRQCVPKAKASTDQASPFDVRLWACAITPLSLAWSQRGLSRTSAILKVQRASRFEWHLSSQLCSQFSAPLESGAAGRTNSRSSAWLVGLLPTVEDSRHCNELRAGRAVWHRHEHFQGASAHITMRFVGKDLLHLCQYTSDMLRLVPSPVPPLPRPSLIVGLSAVQSLKLRLRRYTFPMFGMRSKVALGCFGVDLLHPHPNPAPVLLTRRFHLPTQVTPNAELALPVTIEILY